MTAANLEMASSPALETRVSDRQTRVLMVGFLLTLITFVVRLVPAASLKAVVADVGIYQDMAGYVFRGDNIYQRHLFFPYLPFSQFHPALALWMSESLGMAFDLAIKLIPILTDSLATIVLYAFLVGRTKNLKSAIFWTAVWALNPVSIMITAYHGNIMSSVAFFAMAAYLAMEYAREGANRTRYLAISALCLGIGIAFRTFPILMLPILVILGPRTVKEAVVYVGLALLPGLLSSLPYLLWAREAFLSEILNYGGTTDIGWASVLRTIPYFASGVRLTTFGGELTDFTKGIFLVAYATLVLLLPYFRSSSLGRAMSLMPLFFYVFYAGVAAQYLVWVIPIAIAIRHRLVLSHTVFSTMALYGFYRWYFPEILGGRQPLPPMNTDVIVAVYILGNALLFLNGLIWVGEIALSEMRRYRRSLFGDSTALVKALRVVWSSLTYRAAIIAILLILWLPQFLSMIRYIPRLMRSVLPPTYHSYFPDF